MFYAKMLDFMNDRGVDNSFILYSCAIFGAVTSEEDWVVIMDYAKRAELADELMQRRKNEASEQVKSHGLFTTNLSVTITIVLRVCTTMRFARCLLHETWRVRENHSSNQLL